MGPGPRAGETLDLLINDRRRTLHRGRRDEAAPDDVVVVDIATADRALGREGRVDRILFACPRERPLARRSGPRGRTAPGGAAGRRPPAPPRRRHEGEPADAFGAFRWNLRILSYVALVVGAFLIYNTISVSVVRRRAEIGIVRALGASRRSGDGGLPREAAVLRLGGALLALPLGRLMAQAPSGLIGGDRSVALREQPARAD